MSHRRRRECLGLLVLVSSSPWISAASHRSAAFVASRHLRHQPSSPALSCRVTQQKDWRSHQRAHTYLAAGCSRTSINSTFCIKFSRCYQRFVAYHPRRGRDAEYRPPSNTGLDGINISGIDITANINATMSTSKRLLCRFDDECKEVVESFIFLDEALDRYPQARLVRLDEVADKYDKDDCNQVLPGMGNVSSSIAARIILDPHDSSIGRETDDTGNDIVHTNIERQGYESLQYLASLTASLVADATPTKGKGDMEALQEKILSTLLDRIGLKRFMSHTSQSLQLNYNRLLDLFTRSRPSRLRAVSSEGNANEIIGPGLAFNEAGARSLISYFPELCLYDYHEVEERIHFMLAPLPSPDIVSSLNDAPTSKRKRRGRRPGGSSTDKMEIDWARLSWEGYGAGLTVAQATEAVRAVPNLLSLRHTDSKKPNAFYFIQQLKVPTGLSILAGSNLEKYLIGSDRSDALAYAYLNQIGVRWDQLRILLDAFPTWTFIGTDVDWELRNRGLVKSTLDEFALMFLKKRLQIGTKDVSNMLKTYSRLSLYTTKPLLQKLDTYQNRLGLSSREMRKVVLRMPSLLGMSVCDDEYSTKSALDKRLDFFFNEVGMTQTELKQALLKQPSLLQCSLESLNAKLTFFRDELFISREVVSRILATAPSIFGLSLSENIRPKVATLIVRCRFAPEEVGLVVATVPNILALSTKRKIEPTLSYLSVTLRLPDEASLGTMIKAAPRVLVQGIDASLEPKIRMIEEALAQERRAKSSLVDDELKVVDLCRENPSLLATTNAILAKRISQCHKGSNATLAEALGPSTKGRKQKFGIVKGEVVYLASRSAGEDVAIEGQRERTGVGGYGYSSDMADAIKALMSSGPSLSDLASASTGNLTELSVTAFISGQVFPADTAESVRGINQMGGMAIQITQRLSARQLKVAAESSTSAVIPEDAKPGSNFETGLILLRFPHLRASRHRCDLCACELALKIILNFLKESAASYDLSNFNVRVEICTDSFYAWKMVKDRDNLLRWGSYPSLLKFVYGGPGPKALANPDILYPLSQYFVDLTSTRPRPLTSTRPSSADICIGKNVNVVFKHTSEVCSGRVAELTTRQMNQYARQAAMWAYDSDRKKRAGVS